MGGCCVKLIKLKSGRYVTSANVSDCARIEEENETEEEEPQKDESKDDFYEDEPFGKKY